MGWKLPNPQPQKDRPNSPASGRDLTFEKFEHKAANPSSADSKNRVSQCVPAATEKVSPQMQTFFIIHCSRALI
jgi:hypothetical protein